MIFKRKIYSVLVAWKGSSDRKPLLLKGARQVGKTSLLKAFGKQEFSETAYFNFEEQPNLRQFFENTKDVKRILQNLSLVHGQTIDAAKTLIIFDEIQECQQALNTLKYFCENAPEYAIAGAGSLLGIMINNDNSFPVGKVDFLDLYPLTFTEFLEASDPTLSAYLNDVDKIEVLPDFFFNALLEKFMMYFVVGGMPEATARLVTSSNIEAANKNVKDIVNAYRLDFSKHAPIKTIAKISFVWDAIPAQLARENKKFLYQAIKSGARAREYEDALQWLIDAGLIYKIPRCKKPHFPLKAYDDLSSFKLFVLDIGILRNLATLRSDFEQGHALFTEFKGAITENYILQSLVTQFGETPRYWTSEGRAEVDFLLQYKNEIIPIEVKSDENVRSKSLTLYFQKYKPSLRIRYSLRNLAYDDGLLNIPLFMADFTHKLIDLSIRQNKM